MDVGYDFVEVHGSPSGPGLVDLVAGEDAPRCVFGVDQVPAEVLDGEPRVDVVADPGSGAGEDDATF